MKIYYYCSSCKEENHFKSNNKFDLQMELNSDEVVVNCNKCDKQDKKHINRLHSKPNYIFVFIGILLSIIVSIIMWDIGFASTLSFTIPFYLWLQEQKRVSTFNSYNLYRKR